MAELERQLESTRRESQDRAVEVATVRVEEQREAELATAAEQGLEAAKARQAETEAELRTSLVDTEERSALASERNALELTRNALESE